MGEQGAVWSCKGKKENLLAENPKVMQYAMGHFDAQITMDI